MICQICNTEIDFKYYNAESLRRLQLCFFCDFWWEKIYWRANGDLTNDGHRVVRVNYNHYVVHPDGSTTFQGFGGRKYVIRFHNGDEVTSHNLWHQGEIPKRFREHLPNNAIFVDTRLTCKCRAKFEPMTEAQTMCINCVLGMKPQRW